MVENSSDLQQKKELEKLPEQLSLFTDLSEEGYSQYSNTFELWSLAPKIWHGGARREKTKNIEGLEIVNRKFSYRKRPFSLEIIPAGIRDKKTNKKKDFYPSQREELVEEVLSKLAAKKMNSNDESERPVLVNGYLAVKTTYYEIAKELLRNGHGYKIAEVKLALEVGHRSIISITSCEGKEINYSSPMFPFYARETKEMGGNEKLVVQLHPLVTMSIMEGTHRLINYEKVMGLKKQLSRWLYKRISHMFIQGKSYEKVYQLKMSNIVQDSGMTVYEKPSHQMKQIEICLKELENNKILRCSDKEIKYDDIKKSKIIDAIYTFYITDSFEKDIIKANAITKNRDPRFQIEENLDLENLEREMRKDIFQLPDIYIKNKLKTIKSASDTRKIIIALKEAESKILAGKALNPVAYTKAAINEGYAPKVLSKKKEEDDILESNKIISSINAQKEDFSLDERWFKIKKAIKLGLDQESYEKWLINLEIDTIKEKEIVFVVPNRFIRDWILREFVYNLDKERNLLAIVQHVLPSIGKIFIISKE